MKVKISANHAADSALLPVKSLYSIFDDAISFNIVSRKRKGFLRLLNRKLISSR